tara:strand:+ start:1145 stop:1309 length:165 start_codon:yes stop_codon:yes gene_type:complete
MENKQIIEWVEKEDYESWAVCIRSEQVPIARAIQVMEENPGFAKWYKSTIKVTK